MLLLNISFGAHKHECLMKQGQDYLEDVAMPTCTACGTTLYCVSPWGE